MFPDPILTVGPFSVYMYGVMVAIGVLCAFVVLDVYGRKKNLYPSSVDFTFYLALICTVIGFGSAVLFQSIYDYIKTGVFALDGDMTFLGGLIGALFFAGLGFFLFRKRYPRAFSEVVRILPISITVAHAFGRIGCFCAGCCYGIPNDTWLGVQFPGFAQKVLPTQLYESVFLFILFGIMSYLYLKKDSKKIVSIYLIGYGIFRFLIEFIRDDERGELVALVTPSQFWSVLMVLIGIILLVFANSFFEKAAKIEPSAAEIRSREKAEAEAAAKAGVKAEEAPAEEEGDEAEEPVETEEAPAEETCAEVSPEN